MNGRIEIFLISITFSSLLVVTFSFLSTTKSIFMRPINNYGKKQSRLRTNVIQWPAFKSGKQYRGISHIKVFSSDDNAIPASNYDNDINVKKLPLTILLIDNYDSYTYNLYQYVSEMVGNVIVIPNDVVPVRINGFVQTHQKTWDTVLHYLKVHYPCINRIDGIILGPGPGNPNKMEDVGICTSVSLFYGRL
jgi:hypothetical protein